MLRNTIIAAAVSGVFATSSIAGFVTSYTVTSVSTTLDRIDIYARNDGGGTGTVLLAASISMNADAGKLSYWRSNLTGAPNIQNGADAPDRSFVRIDSDDGSTTSIVSRTPAGNWPIIGPAGPSFNNVAIEDFGATITALAGGKPASTGAGALFASLYVDKNYGGVATGNLGGEVGLKVPYTLSITTAAPNVVPVIAPVPDTNVVFGSIVSNGAPFSVTVNATDADSADILALAVGSVPGITGVTVVGGSTSPASFTVTGTVNYSLNGTTVVVPVSVSDGAGGHTVNGAFRLVVTPEPASLSLIGLGGLLLGRRRK